MLVDSHLWAVLRCAGDSMENFSRSIARCAAGQIIDSAGFEAVQESALDMVTELIMRYISEVGAASHTYAELAGRTDTNALDVVSRRSSTDLSSPLGACSVLRPVTGNASAHCSGSCIR